MRKFIGKIALFLVLCLIITLLPAYIIDPFNVFHWANIRDNGVEPNKNYIKTKYILNNPDKFDGFLFGSSRVEAIHVENIEKKHIYNMTYSMGLPREHLETLKTFIDNGIKVDIVYIGVDSLSYTITPLFHYNYPVRCPYQQMSIKKMIKLYMDPTMIVRSISTIVDHKYSINVDAFYEYGWGINYGRNTSTYWSRAWPSVGSSYLLDETLQDIRDIKLLCDEHNIELVLFTNPMYEITYEESVNNINYLEFLVRLADITDYYNFSGINDVTTNTDYYFDASHYNTYLGDMLIDVLCNGKIYDDLYAQGFGWYVTSENVEELIDIIK